jgi:tetratricopeptide (TPR) repeat protein
LDALAPGDHEERYRATLGLAACSFHLGEDALAIEHATRLSTDLADELGSALARGDTVAVEGVVRADAARAIEHFDAQAVQLARNAWLGLRDDALGARARLLAQTIASVHCARSPLAELGWLEEIGPQEAFDWLRGYSWTSLGTSSYVHADSAAEMIAWLERAYAVLDAARWPGRRATTALHLGYCYEALAQDDRSLEYSEEAARSFRLVGDERLLVRALASLGHGHAALGDYPRALAALEEALPSARRLGDAEGLVLALRQFAACQVALGANARALTALEEALGLGTRSLLLRAKLASEIGHVLALMGEADRALPYLEESVRLHDDIGEPRDRTGALSRLASGLPRSARLSGARFDLLLGAEASKSNLKESLGGHRGVHLAVHGYVDVEFPWFSGLVLSGEGGEPCSFLNLAEIAGFELDADLVFLSACETARGESMRSEGIRNAARAFLLAGARTVVATQWTVGDEASALLARRFYEGLFAGATAAEALRGAKLALIGGGGAATETVTRGISTTRSESAGGQQGSVHPAFWAPYVIWGHAR